MGGAVCSGRKWLTEGRGQDQLLLVGEVVALGNLSPLGRPAFAWLLPMLSPGSDWGVGLERTVFRLGFAPLQEERFWVPEESNALGGVNGNRGL